MGHSVFNEHSVFNYLDSMLISRLGTFQDNLRVPVHRWFKYPAGFSYRLVEMLIDEFRLTQSHWILDPFVGSGTVSIVAKQKGVNSVGIEAHPFIHWVARVKCFWEFDMKRLYRKLAELLAYVRCPLSAELHQQDLTELPELLHKCFSERNLRKLKFIRETIKSFDLLPEERDFSLLALVNTLRTATKAGAGWPYIAPSKYHAKKSEMPLKYSARLFTCSIRTRTAQPFVVELPASSRDGFLGSPLELRSSTRARSTVPPLRRPNPTRLGFRLCKNTVENDKINNSLDVQLYNSQSH